MDIAFRARNVEVPESLRSVTLARVTRVAGRCGIDRADVCFFEERNPRIAEREVCEVTLWGQARILRAHAAATEVSAAADRVVGKLEQRADRLRGRQSGRRYRPECGEPGRRLGAWVTSPGGGSVHFGTNWSVGGRVPGAVDHVGDDAGKPADMGISDTEAEPMTPEEAALEMGEQGRDTFFFVNVESGRPAAVYLRRDGEIAVVDATRAASLARIDLRA